ncbi:MAG: response regulator [Planctomycetes bacterium]|nr:response regulator [Planctomycetota bacterium]
MEPALSSQCAAQESATLTVVEDEPAALDVMLRAARSWDFDCQAARSAEEALDLLEKTPTPLVVTDLRMPGRGGVWLVREIHKRWPDTSVIVVTGGAEPEGLEQSLDAGACHYFLKPINFDEFHHALEAALRTQRARSASDRRQRSLETRLLRQKRKLRHTFLCAVASLVRTLEARDPYTSGHSLRVRRLVLKLARRLRLDGRLRTELGLAATLHDIGKVGLPEALLNKAGPLSAEEQAVVQQHPIIGERILGPILRNRAILAAIRGHHERFDGLGYPDHLRGEAIPLPARIIALADCFDALTSSRAYRHARPRAEALQILREGAGTQFDPQLLPAFLEVV